MNEERKIVYDEQLKVEAYQFRGIMQKFPNHFHEYYVIGFIENGKRRLSCKNQIYEVTPGDLLLFDAGVNHTCEQIGDQLLDYRCLNISETTMLEVMREINGEQAAQLPIFPMPLIHDAEQTNDLQKLHKLIMKQTNGLEKEELFFFLMNELISKYSSVNHVDNNNEDIMIETVCNYISTHYSETVSLEMLSDACHMGKYSMLRRFTEIKGITPYQYLISVRVNKAMDMLKSGMEPIDIALKTGFTDQSHFSNTFKKSIGLTPGQYKMLRKWQ